MADVGGLGLDQDLAFHGAFQIDGLDGERLARLTGGGTDREDLSCLILADRNGMAAIFPGRAGECESLGSRAGPGLGRLVWRFGADPSPPPGTAPR